MLLTIERVAILRAIDIFANTPDYVLASVARIVEEVDVAAGVTFIEDGALETCMYIIVDGEVRVHNNDKTVLLLGAGTTVGELAVLDPDPRSASVTAVRDTFLFRIDKEPLDEALADRPEIALGIIRALSRRLRIQGRRLSDAAETPSATTPDTLT